MKTKNFTIGFMLLFGLTGSSSFAQCDELTTTITSKHLCEGELLTLEATSINGGVVTWDSGVINGIEFTPAVGVSTFTATSDNMDDCLFEVEITVNALPDVTISAVETELCEGDVVTLTGEGAIIYDWTLGIIDGEPFTPELGSSTYFVLGMDDRGCSAKDSIELNVYPVPVIKAMASDTSICEGESITLRGVAAGSMAGTMFTWNYGAINEVPFAPPVGTYNYVLTGTNSWGCSAVDSIQVTVHELPTINISASSTELCFGESFTLFGVGAETYSWDGGIINGEETYPSSAGLSTYTVTGTDTNGCDNTATIDILVRDLPTVTGTVDVDTICFGDEVTLIGGGAITYTWDFGATDGEAFTPISVGTTIFTVTGTDSFGCTNTANVTLMINALPAITASIDDADICIGETFIFTAGGVDEFTWDMGVIDGEPYSPAGIETITYTVTGIDENGCENSASINATMHPLPAVIATVDQDSICFGESAIFNGEGADTYVWDMGVINGVTFTPDVTGTLIYNVEGTDIYGCTNTSFVSLNMNEEINVAYVLTEEVLGFDGAIDITVSGGTPAYSFDWSNDGTGDFDDDEDLIGLTSGYYTVVVADSRLCQQILTFNIDDQLGLDNVQKDNVVVYPNPFKDVINIQSEGNFVYEVYGINGVIIETGASLNNKILNLEMLPSGIYFVNVNNGSSTSTKKIVKQ
tara:strand:+ start:861 stop:2948 length:2088 start_codon:yes stop_codon:yes gene_type:complete